MKTFGILAMGSVLAACTTPVPPVPIPSTVTPLPGNQYSGATDVSDSGRIVGFYGSQAAEFQTAGNVTLLPSLPAYASCQAVSITNDGTAAGTCVRAEHDPTWPRAQAVYWDSARALHPLIGLEPTTFSSGVIDMNDAGVIIGSQSADAARWTYWIHDLRTGTRRDLPQLPGGFAEPRAINDAGDIAGVFFVGFPNSGDRLPIKWSANTLAITVLPTLLNCPAEANGINNHGVVVGFGCYGVYGNHSSALVWPSATELPEVLPAPGSPGYRLQRVSATSLNDAGDVIGAAIFGNGDIRGPSPGVGWTADRQLALFEGATPNAINDSRVTVGVGGFSVGYRAVFIDW